MILVDNRNVLRLRNRELLNKLSVMEENIDEFSAEVETAKTGVPTLKLNLNGKTQYVHSKYDPEKEAGQLMGRLEGIDSTRPMLFVGVGLGYHIKRFTEMYPTIKFSIYEPDEEILVSYLSNKRLSDLPLNNLTRIFTGKDEAELLQELTALWKETSSEIQIYTLPVYKNIYDFQLKVIMQKALEVAKDKRSTVAVDLAFQTRWTINSIKNFPTILETPNILHDIDRSEFEGKPAIIVAAGPSLNEEFENLRYIKEHGLAYIFSVGSAINSLIEHGIYPDAVCTYDPQEINYKVIQIIKDKGLNEIPLVFGSTVGFETLVDYPGKMLHMIVSQDTISRNLLEHTGDIPIDGVNDAPSIAVVTYQLLSKLGFENIILVGQNLAYLDNMHYANGIDYGTGSHEVALEKLSSALIVKDVQGGEVKTNESMNSMRKQLEMYISLTPSVKVYNTTTGGAAIEGTVFKPLTDIIQQLLKDKVVQANWAHGSSGYSRKYLDNQIVVFDEACTRLEKVMKNAMAALERIHQKVRRRNFSAIEIEYSQLDKEINRMKDNPFYIAMVEPMIRVQNEHLAEKSQAVRYTKSQIQKGEVIVREFHEFLNECSRHYYFVVDLYNEMKMKIKL